jgi:hypothetical protein
MNPKDFIKSLFTSFFIVVTLVTIAMGLLGLTFEADRTFGYEAFFFPLFYSVLGMLPAIIMYSKKELTIRQMIFRKLLQLALIEFLLLGFMMINGFSEIRLLVTQAIVILLISLSVTGISWLLDIKNARELNKDLVEYQNAKRNINP